jgi:serine/threonine-protein kinase RsbT
MEPASGPDVRVPVASDIDIVSARQQGRALAMRLGFSSSDATMVATAISELARNIVLYAKRGEIVLAAVVNSEHRGLAITACDDGDGIADIRQALQDGYSTSGRMGVGLPGVKRLMDEFEISSTVGKGTVVSVKKWGR